MFKSTRLISVATAVACGLSACSVETEQVTRRDADYSTRLLTSLETSTYSGADSTRAKPEPSEQSMNVYLTGYSYWDNTPRGSAQIARPVIHRSAGGTGTYDDPVTLAVGHIKTGTRSVMDYPAGTRFYIEKLRKYAIVEDLCGDGNTPQYGPCHSGYQGHDWLDIYVGGRSVGEAHSDRCMYSITGIQNVILNPQRGYEVHPGEISTSTCATL
ncbi:hypothetical protein PH5382_02494 [Phaeobacter sp. CECT 5382]|uniref:hypothetical protein n=1 Tax=Rhodobacterales TaxID=204455 RepID=UPI0006D9D612|nr:hypothetical protein [Phaeobacter sp. CECT 5382]CUH88558.1 hypothetical protein PH5382_02494 [Phaeobacter sp. CECT 5382]